MERAKAQRAFQAGELRLPAACHVTIRSLTVAVALAACSLVQAQSRVEKALVGETKVSVLHTYRGQQPLTKPSQTAIYDFEVPLDAITLDHSPVAHILNHDPIARMKHDEGRDESREAVAKKVSAVFSKTLVKELNKSIIPVSYSSEERSPTSVDTLEIRGSFTIVNQGNKTKRMLIGFGRGASDVNAHVCVSLSAHGIQLVIQEFEISSQSGKKPGAAATMGVGSVPVSVAVDGVTDGKETVEGDATRMAKAVAKQIENLMVAQGWAASVAQKQ